MCSGEIQAWVGLAVFVAVRLGRDASFRGGDSIALQAKRFQECIELEQCIYAVIAAPSTWIWGVT